MKQENLIAIALAGVAVFLIVKMKGKGGTQQVWQGAPLSAMNSTNKFDGYYNLTDDLFNDYIDSKLYGSGSSSTSAAKIKTATTFY